MSLKNVMWGSKAFDNKVISTIPKPEGPTDKKYIVGLGKFELIDVNQSDPAMIKKMLRSGSYRYATESEVKHWQVIKECELYR